MRSPDVVAAERRRGARSSSVSGSQRSSSSSRSAGSRPGRVRAISERHSRLIRGSTGAACSQQPAFASQFAAHSSQFEVVRPRGKLENSASARAGAAARRATGGRAPDERIAGEQVDDEPGALLELASSWPGAQPAYPRTRAATRARRRCRADRRRGRWCRGRRGSARIGGEALGRRTADDRTRRVRVTCERDDRVGRHGPAHEDDGRATRPGATRGTRRRASSRSGDSARCRTRRRRRARASARRCGRSWDRRGAVPRRAAVRGAISAAPCARSSRVGPGVGGRTVASRDDERLVRSARVCATRSGPPTCAPIPMSSPRTSSTGRDGSAARRRGRAPGTVDEVAAVLRAVQRRTAPGRCPRAATPDSSAARCRCTASSCSTSAGSTRSGRSTRAPARSPRRPA